MSVTRYTIVTINGNWQVRGDTNGPWVWIEDHAAEVERFEAHVKTLEAALLEARAQRDTAEVKVRPAEEAVFALEARVTKLEERNTALQGQLNRRRDTILAPLRAHVRELGADPRMTLTADDLRWAADRALRVASESDTYVGGQHYASVLRERDARFRAALAAVDAEKGETGSE